MDVIVFPDGESNLRLKRFFSHNPPRRLSSFSSTADLHRFVGAGLVDCRTTPGTPSVVDLPALWRLCDAWRSAAARARPGLAVCKLAPFVLIPGPRATFADESALRFVCFDTALESLGFARDLARLVASYSDLEPPGAASRKRSRSGEPELDVRKHACVRTR